jgi:hypothetical protein
MVMRGVQPAQSVNIHSLLPVSMIDGAPTAGMDNKAVLLPTARLRLLASAAHVDCCGMRVALE